VTAYVAIVVFAIGSVAVASFAIASFGRAHTGPVSVTPEHLELRDGCPTPERWRAAARVGRRTRFGCGIRPP
jgi:hypothetical protein